jgi:hypothetical protein
MNLMTLRTIVLAGVAGIVIGNSVGTILFRGDRLTGGELAFEFTKFLAGIALFIYA